MENSHLDFEPRSTNKDDSLRISLIEAASFTGAPPLAKVSSCRVSVWALTEAVSASFNKSNISSSGVT